MEQLKGKKCSSCGFETLEPSFCCPNCGHDELNEVIFEGSGTIYTYTVVHVGFGHLAERVPYVLAVVELKEGLKVLTIVEDIDINKAAINLPVKYKRTEEKVGPIFQTIAA